MIMVTYKKKYEDVLSKARKIHNETEFDYEKGMMEEIFPELAESGEEKIRKELTEFLKNASGGFLDTTIQCKTFGKWLAWLEKQGNQERIPKHKIGDIVYYNLFREVKSMVVANIVTDSTDNPMYEDENGNAVFEKDLIEQKPTDKVEPKFKVADWIVNNQTSNIFLVKEVIDGEYCLWPLDGIIQGYLRIIDVDTEYRLWTIQDAKDGDFLAVEDKNFTTPFVAIYKERGLDFFNSHCFIGFDGNFYKGEEGHDIENIHPATKEQRELLFSKIEEAGYEWNGEKKELKKFHVIDEGKVEMDYCFTKMMNDEKVSSTWNKKDEHRVKDIIYFLDTAKKHYASTVELDTCIDWLKSLKGIVHPKQEWSEEDEHMFNSCCAAVAASDYYTLDDKQDIENWLNDIKQRIGG